jgi:peptidyl-prolyl cis-trans isomerase C
MMKLSARRHALALGLAAGLAASPAFAADGVKDPVVAVVNGAEMHLSQLVEFQRQLPPQLSQAPYEALLEIVINNQLVSEQAKKEKLENDPEVKAAVKQAEAKFMRQAWMTKKLRTAVTDDAVKQRYDQMLREFTPAEEVHARHILVESEDGAKAVIAELGRGADFAELAKTRSKDPSAAQNGGDLGYFGKGDMVPEFANAAFAMKPGELAKAPVKTQFGWHVIKVEDKRMSSPPSFEQAKPGLRDQMAEGTAEKVVGELRDKAKIKRFGPDGTPMPEAKK